MKRTSQFDVCLACCGWPSSEIEFCCFSEAFPSFNLNFVTHRKLYRVEETSNLEQGDCSVAAIGPPGRQVVLEKYLLLRSSNHITAAFHQKICSTLGYTAYPLRVNRKLIVYGHAVMIELFRSFRGIKAPDNLTSQCLFGHAFTSTVQYRDSQFGSQKCTLCHKKST